MANYREDTVDLDCELKNETEKAWLVVIDDEEIWFPKSRCEWHAQKNGIDSYITIPMWLAKKHELA